MTTDPRPALDRLTRWRDDLGCPPIYRPDGWLEFSADVLALLSTVEQMREALVLYADAANACHHSITGIICRGCACERAAAPTEDKPHD